MGFDVIAFESGIYDCDVAWSEFKDGSSPLSSAQKGVFGIWTGSSQTEALWEYIADQVDSDKPLQLAGFDCQFTASGSRSFLKDEIDSLSEKFGAIDLEEGERENFFNELKLVLANKKPKGNKDDFLATLDKIRSVVATFDNESSNEQSRFWLQNLKSIRDHCGRQFENTKVLENVAARDKQMADNLAWMLKTQFPDRKVIVWAASFHIARQLNKVRVPDNSVDYRKLKQMGQYVHESFGDEIFTVGFTTFKGRAGSCFGQPYPVAAAPEGTLESLLNATELENGWLNLKGTTESAPWLNEKLYSRPLGYTWMLSKWPEQFDAMVFNREMKPSTR